MEIAPKKIQIINMVKNVPLDSMEFIIDIAVNKGT